MKGSEEGEPEGCLGVLALFGEDGSTVFGVFCFLGVLSSSPGGRLLQVLGKIPVMNAGEETISSLVHKAKVCAFSALRTF